MIDKKKLEKNIFKIINELYELTPESQKRIKQEIDNMKIEQKKTLFMMLYKKYTNKIKRLKKLVNDLTLISYHIEDQKESISADEILKNNLK